MLCLIAALLLSIAGPALADGSGYVDTGHRGGSMLGSGT